LAPRMIACAFHYGNLPAAALTSAAAFST